MASEQEKEKKGCGGLVFAAFALLGAGVIAVGVAGVVASKVSTEDQRCHQPEDMTSAQKSLLQDAGVFKSSDVLVMWYAPSQFPIHERATLLFKDRIVRIDKTAKKKVTKVTIKELAAFDLKRDTAKRESTLHLGLLSGQSVTMPIGSDDDTDRVFLQKLREIKCVKPATCGLEHTLLAQRKSFRSKIKLVDPAKPFKPAKPPSQDFALVQYPSKAGKLSAYISPDPKDGVKHPLIIWAHGGFHGIGPKAWSADKDGTASVTKAFRDEKILVMYPSWRAENDNPGRFELFYGEVEDVLSALEYAKTRSYVDPNRIYLGGHSTGGTLVLLAMSATDGFRAGFSIGGAPDVVEVFTKGDGYRPTPFDSGWEEELRLRSPVEFVQHIKNPTFYFEGEASFYVDGARTMARKAREKKVPFTSLILAHKDRKKIVSPLTVLLAKKIKEDKGETCAIEISKQEAEEAARGGK